MAAPTITVIDDFLPEREPMLGRKRNGIQRTIDVRQRIDFFDQHRSRSLDGTVNNSLNIGSGEPQTDRYTCRTVRVLAGLGAR